MEQFRHKQLYQYVPIPNCNDGNCNLCVENNCISFDQIACIVIFIDPSITYYINISPNTKMRKINGKIMWNYEGCDILDHIKMQINWNNDIHYLTINQTVMESFSMDTELIRFLFHLSVFHLVSIPIKKMMRIIVIYTKQFHIMEKFVEVPMDMKIYGILLFYPKILNTAVLRILVQNMEKKEKTYLYLIFLQKDDIIE